MRITVIHDIPKGYIEGLLDSAGRGASYWCSNELEYANPVKKLLNGGTMIVEDTEAEDEPVKHKLTVEKIRAGLAIMARNHPDDFANVINGTWDMQTGDVLLQLALFKEVIYG